MLPCPLAALLTLLCLPPALPITTPTLPPPPPGVGVSVSVGRAGCARRIEARLDAMHRREEASQRHGLDFEGYALHQPLQQRGYDMYVTGVRVRVPGRAVWFRVDRCDLSPDNRSLAASLLFQDMAVTGLVRLYDPELLGQDAASRPLDACNMTLRFRKAGVTLGAHAQSASGRTPPRIETRAAFVEPDFVSVHGRGCQAPPPGRPLIEHRRRAGAERDGARGALARYWHAVDDIQEAEGRTGRADGGRRGNGWDNVVEGRGVDEAGTSSVEAGDAERQAAGAREREAPRWLRDRAERDDDLAAEVEDVFLRGVKSLLTSYLDKQLQPALRETLMAGMGYTVSYG